LSARVTKGVVARGFEEVGEEFERNFAARDELGAAFAAYRDGEPIVDLWGGVAHPTSGRAWDPDTLGLFFSGSKGFVAICLLLLLDRGELELSAPVARYWPEFAANGKERVLVRDVVSHTARLPAIEAPVSLEQLPDDRAMAELLAAQAPNTDPRAALCYHAMTYGWLCGELVRRVSGRSIGGYFAEEVAKPLDLELWIGLPRELEERVATLALADGWPTRGYLQSNTFADDPLNRLVWGNPDVFSPEAFPWNRRAFHASEIPGVNAIGTARSAARLYASLERLVSAETLELARTPLSDGWDELHQGRAHFGVGFQLQTELEALGPPAEAFGHGGAGGSRHGCWPAQRVGFSYLMNLVRDDAEIDPRPQALLEALHRCVASTY
jgi:CubicO group peptidase (beta-lactamase class C family)